MSAGATEKNVSAASKNETKRKDKVRKTLRFLFGQNGLTIRNIQHTESGEVAVDDLLACDNCKALTLDDFELALPKDCHDEKLKEESHFLLLTVNGRKTVKYFEEGVTYKERSGSTERTNDKEVMKISDEEVEEEEAVSGANVEEDQNQSVQSVGEEEQEEEKKTERTSGGKKKKNKNKKKASGAPLEVIKSGKVAGGTGELVVKEASISEKSEAAEGKVKNKGTEKNDLVDDDHMKTSQADEDAKALTKGGSPQGKSSDRNDLHTAADGEEAFTSVSSKKKSKKKGKQPESGGRKNNDAASSKQHVEEKRSEAAVEKMKNAKGSNKKPEEKPEEKEERKRSEAENVGTASAAKESKKKDEDSKMKTEKASKTNKEPKRTHNDLASRDQLSDEETSPYSSAEPGSKKQKKKTEAPEKKIPKVFEFLFLKDGLKQKEIVVRDNGFVEVKSILEAFADQYSWTQNDVVSALEKVSGFMFEDDDSGNLLVKCQLSKPNAVADEAETLTRGKEEDSKWEEHNKRKGVSDHMNGSGATAGGETRQKFSRDSGYSFRPRSSQRDFFLSKTMSFLLRHGAERLRLPMQSDGFLFVDDLLQYKDLKGYTEVDVERVVRDNDKQRFLLAEDPQTKRLKVRANQGHTMEVPDLELESITSAKDVPVVIHGTYHKAWKIIQSEGLRCMGRNHIHFAAGEPGADDVISGMRNSCDVLIYIDLEKALNDGMKFFRSANNVILCPGDNKGILSPKYFSSAVQRQPRVKLL